MNNFSFDKAIDLLNKKSYDEAESELIRLKKLILIEAQKSDNSSEKKVYISYVHRIDSLIEEINKKRIISIPKEENIEVKKDNVEIVRFSDVIGLEDVKTSLRNRIIYPYIYPEIYSTFNKKPGGGVLLYGPPGTGKTMVVKALANEIGAEFFSIKCSTLLSKYFGESETNIRNLFEKANESHKAVIFFDELDALATQRDSSDGPMNRVVAELLTSIDGFSKISNNLLIIGATNIPWSLDDAMIRPPRFSDMIYVSLPELKTREELFKLKLEDVKKDEINYLNLAELTDGYSAADITEIIEKSKDYPINRAITTNEIGELKMEDLLLTISRSRKSVTEDLVKKYENYNEKSGAVLNNDFKKTTLLSNEEPLINKESHVNEDSHLNDTFDYSKGYVRPPLDLLKSYDNHVEVDHEKNISMINKTFEEYQIKLTDVSYVQGVLFTRYLVRLEKGERINKVRKSADEIRMRMKSANIRIIAPIQGMDAIGVEIPNEVLGFVGLKDLLHQSKEIRFPLGVNVNNECVECDILSSPHILVGGSTGSGKSVNLNILINSILFKYSPDDVRLLLVDPKRVEFNIYKNIPHSLTTKPLFETDEISRAFSYLINEMERRYQLLEENYCRNIGEYNKKYQKLPYIIAVVDEFSSIVSNDGSFMDKVTRLSQLSRAAGIHLYFATQRPSADVITGTIKNNFTTRIAFSVASIYDSRTIINETGAENLIGKGDMLYSKSGDTSERVQGAYISLDEIIEVVNFVRDNNKQYKKIDKIVGGAESGE